MLKGTCIGFLPDAGCGLIYADEAVNGSRIVFVHFRDIEPQNGRQDLKSGSRVEYVLSNALGYTFCRPLVASGPRECLAGAVLGSNTFIKSFTKPSSNSDMLRFCEVGCLSSEGSFSKSIVVIEGEISESWEPDRTLFEQGDIFFYKCKWLGKAQFSEWKVRGDLIFLGCSFTDFFTLKEAEVDGAVHMEGCDFSGAGGASFRGLQAKALYLDFGVKGPRDMVWLNEMWIQNDVVLGGEFEGAIQVMRVQDERVTTQTCRDNDVESRACFQTLYVGKEFYKSQNINRSVLSAGLDVHGLTHGECLVIENTELGSLQMFGLSGEVELSCVNSKVLGSVVVEGCDKHAVLECVDFQNSYIEGHLSVKQVNVRGSLNLDDATVERVVRLHQVKFGAKNGEVGGLKLARLSVNRFVMDDFSALYGLNLGESVPKWKNPQFNMLWREHQKQGLQQGCNIELVQEYVLLKNLLSQEGQLKLEDEAFYNMRKLGHWYQDIGMMVFNYIFGWGVRLQNILISVLLVLVAYTVIYHLNFPSLEISDAFQLSVQSMFMAFFGEMVPKVVAGSPLSWLVLTESVLGVVFVTVFVGAYVRKLLR